MHLTRGSVSISVPWRRDRSSEVLVNVLRRYSHAVNADVVMMAVSCQSSESPDLAYVLNFMATYEFHGLELILDEFYSAAASNSRKKEIEVILEQYSRQPDAVHFFLSGFSSSNQFVSMFCLTSLDKLISQRWIGLLPEERFKLRTSLLQMLEQHHANCPVFLRNKLMKLIVDIAGISWPLEYSDFIDHVFQMVQVSPEVGLSFLLITSEELGCPRGNLTMSRKNEIQKLLHIECPRIISTLLELLSVILSHYKTAAVHSRPVSEPALYTGLNWKVARNDWMKVDERSRSLAALALSCLAHVLSWAPISIVSSYEPRKLLDLVFHFAIADTTGPVGEAALGVLVEIVSKNLVPVQSEAFLEAVYRDTYCLLRLIVIDNRNTVGRVGPNYLDKMTEYLKSFLGTHIRRLQKFTSKHCNAPFADFMEFVLIYTVKLSPPEKMFAAFEIWTSYLEFVYADIEQEERTGTQLEDHSFHSGAYCLKTLADKILEHVQFKHNFETLDSLDNLTIDENGYTEWTFFVKECIEMLAKISAVTPQYAVHAITLPLEAALKVYLQLETTVAEENGKRWLMVTADHECQKLHRLLRDLATFLQAAGRFGEFFVGDYFRNRFSCSIGIFTMLCETAAMGARVKFYATDVVLPDLKSDFEEAMAQSLAALRPWCRYLADSVLEHQTVPPDFIQDRLIQAKMPLEDYEKFVSMIFHAAVACITPDAPVKISQSAGQLLCSLTKTVHPLQVMESEVMKSLVERLPAGGFDRATELLVYRSVANSILSTSNKKGMDPQWTLKRDQLQAFVRSLTGDYLSMTGVVDLGPETLQSIGRAVEFITDLVVNVEDDSTSVKGAVFFCIQPHLAVALHLLGPCVAGSPLIAEALLNLILKLFEVMRMSLGVNNAAKIIEAILSAFSASGVMENCFAPNTTPKSAGKVRLMELMLAIFATDSGGSPAISAAFVAPTLDLCLDKIWPLVSMCPELAGPLIEVFARVMLNNWRFFFGTSLGGASGDLLNGREHVFRRIMEAFGWALVQQDLQLFRQTLAALGRLDDKWRLYSKKIFKENMLRSFEKVLMDALIEGHNLLQEEIVDAMHSMAQSDMADFYQYFFPQYIRADAGLNDEQRNKLLTEFMGMMDSSSYKDNLMVFANDVRYYHEANKCLTGSV
ncbi:unnamed protein product [Notodromas monacha]|uniref:Exportin-1/Importin-beta-like domain-containing protein n=1 Tax=Notodromas monacha TaxID=399045 RepID=A0A7R9BRY6_9CRUS|nr:unnamed protein product [Notodromas monacha]CAG0919518.1 unnamed protein product [Notodromas monacha]